MSATRADARRWFAANAGREVTTVQVRPSGMTWEPGPRTVAVSGSKVTLDGSTVSFTRDHVVLDVTEEMVRLEWLDEDGVTIHVTTYRAQR